MNYKTTCEGRHCDKQSSLKLEREVAANSS
jgi:hypothetical protein